MTVTVIMLNVIIVMTEKEMKIKTTTIWTHFLLSYSRMIIDYNIRGINAMFRTLCNANLLHTHPPCSTMTKRHEDSKQSQP